MFSDMNAEELCAIAELRREGKLRVGYCSWRRFFCTVLAIVFALVVVDINPVPFIGWGIMAILAVAVLGLICLAVGSDTASYGDVEPSHYRNAERLFGLLPTMSFFLAFLAFMQLIST